MCSAPPVAVPATARLLPLACVALALVALLVATPARAYVLPADFLLRLVADGRRPAIKDVALTLEITDGEAPAGDGLPAADAAKPLRRASWLMRRPGQLRCDEARPDAAAETAVYPAADQPNAWRAAVVDGGPRALLGLLLLPGGGDLDATSAALLTGLTAAGIDPNTTTLGRWQQDFVYVVGGATWQQDRPQLWLDKNTFAPVRLLWPREEACPIDPKIEQAAANLGASAGLPHQAASLAAPVRELRLAHYVGGLPRAIEEWACGKRLYRAEVVRVVQNQRPDDALFVPGAGASRDPSATHRH